MNAWYSQMLVRDLGWTLVHFLWEGLAIAGLLALTLRLMRRSPAHYRYLAGCAALTLMACAPVVTLVVVERLNPSLPATSASGTSPWTVTTRQAASTLPPIVVTAQPEANIASLSERLETAFPWLVLFWVLGVCALSCRLFAGWLQVRRLRRVATEPLPWPQRLTALAQRLGVSRPVRLLQSALVEVPTVIGWLRPVILLPASCVTGLTPAQLEAIIAHELAHVRRHDYLINLLQSAVETLWFYHPAVWWVSRRVREDRELCCDDLAVAVCGDRAGYARALATLEELRPASAQLALAAGGAPLLKRIRRLAGQPERSAGRASWPVAGIAVLLVLGILATGMREHRAAAAQPIAGQITYSAGQMDVNASPPVPTAPQPPVPAKVIAQGLAVEPPPVVPPAVAPPIAPATSTTNSVADTNVAGPTTNSTKLEIVIAAKFVQITSAPGETNFIFSSPGIGPRRTVGPVNCILTDAQFRETLNALEQHQGTEVLASPSMVITSRGHGRFEVGTVQTIVLGQTGPNTFNTTNMLFGTSMDATATISADNKSISMTLVPTVREFNGYQKGLPVTSVSAGGTNTAMMAVPLISTRTMNATVTVLDGQTVVLGGLASDDKVTMKSKVPVLGSIPLLGRLFRSTTSQTVRKELLVFVTANIINPDGTLYNSAAEKPALLAEPAPPSSTNQ